MTTRFLDETPELFNLPTRRDHEQAAEVHRRSDRNATRGRRNSEAARCGGAAGRFRQRHPADGHSRPVQETWAAGFAKWVRNEKRLFITDTTMRDAHQSLFADADA
ncbi:MAG: hypothetical protein U0791_00960 [Gemmataceae bacterium]